LTPAEGDGNSQTPAEASQTSTAPTPAEAKHARDSAAGLVLSGISVRFGGLVALDDVSLRVQPDRVVGVIGPNGAGKTTLFNVVCGFIRPISGSMTLDGRPLRPHPQQLSRLGIARTLQGIGLFSGLTVLENVMCGMTNRAKAGFLTGLLGLWTSDADERRLRHEAETLLAELGVGAFANALPDSLPYAVRKRVALARALAARPRLLLLDEPAGGLGTEDIHDLATLIRSLPQRDGGGCSVLLVEHHMDLVMQVCDEIVVLDFGRCIAAGTPKQVQDNPAVTEAYLGAEVDASDVAQGTVT
jgi:branched-chain amino acid transport system ATP-binding protein